MGASALVQYEYRIQIVPLLASRANRQSHLRGRGLPYDLNAPLSIFLPS